MISIIVFEFFLLIYGILVNMSVYILDFKLSFDHGLQLVNDVSVLNGVLAHFIVIFSCFRCFQVNFNELAIIYPTVLFPPNIYIANFVFCLVIFLNIYGFIEYYAEY